MLKEETDIFDGFGAGDVDQMSQLFKILTFRKGEEIAKNDDIVDFLGVIVHGSAFICFENKNFKELTIGDMIGQNLAAEFTTREQHMCTVVAQSDGMIAVLPFGEIKGEIRRSPEAIFKIMMVASKKAMETLYFNVHGSQ